MINRKAILLALTGCGIALAATKPPRSPLQLSVDSGRPLLGVYQGAGCDGVNRLKQFERWFGREADQVLDFVSWRVLQAGTTWGMKCWSDARRRIVVYSVPMLPDDRSATLAAGASGAFDDLFRAYATSLVKYGYGSSIIRLGWEFNGNWYSWQASLDPQSWVAYWRRIVDIMRAVPGANFRFDWNPAASGSFNPELVYPGDDYVDVIGLDFYNVSWDPKVVTSEQRWKSRFNGTYGPKWHREFALKHGKPMSYPEWGTGIRSDGHGGGDDAYFIRQMGEWIAANNVLYHDYWDYPLGDFNGALSDEHQPAAGAEFLKVFGGRAP